uniref:Uncharacterized protein n=1 Tax=Romanomermis culicivorax TaxID=13658 RepID=A0A915IJ22_ROMCU
MPVTLNDSTTPKRTGQVSVVPWYQPMEGTMAPLASLAAQGLLPGIPMDSALEVSGQLESMNLIAPAALRILGPKVAREALEFITNGTIWKTPVDKILLDGEPSLLAVDVVCCTVEQGHNA